MKRLFVLLAAAAALAASAQMVYFLERQWVAKNGDRFCQYTNGTILNVGYQLCPLSIKG